jgi:tetratricopeptide (TPR) repeat protein
MLSRVAEAHWRAARLHDRLGEHARAAENFLLASKNYQVVSEKIPKLKGFYEEYALYMQAWNEIENARSHHVRQEYGLAEEHFRKTAEIHKSLKRWSYMAPNYSAWAQVENAEELSRTEESERAIKAFEQAANIFSETKRSIQTRSGIENPDEKHMADAMLVATDVRHEYCMARIAVEEARILDKKGDHCSSSEKYGYAAEIFENIGRSLESEQEQEEFKLIITLSKAWQKMTLAESEASPQLYVEASQLFERAKEFSSNEKTKMLLLGHSRFCKALEAGTRFADTRDADVYAGAVRYLESASNYYVKAGLPKVSEYSEAMKLLFDAYLRIDNAARESDPEKKAKLYAMAEKVLQTSAGSFMKAEHPEKREQVLGLLDKIKTERELAASLIEVVHAPSIVSATSSFCTPTPTREEAVGSERFEHADIQANLIVRQKELRVGEPLTLEIELVNAGKGAALLIKVNEVIPRDFELTERPEIYRVEDSYLNLKGKRLDPLKSEEIRLVLKPKAQGAFALKPTIMYLDEDGRYKSHEPEPVTVTVKELGVKGWLKGER